jgi:hypothetical protein
MLGWQIYLKVQMVVQLNSICSICFLFPLYKVELLLANHAVIQLQRFLHSQGQQLTIVAFDFA